MADKSPPLTEKELQLVLHVYTTVGKATIGASHPKVRWLSDVLRQLPIHDPDERPSGGSFRSPGGLARRIREFHQIADGRNPRKLDRYREVWAQYKDDPDGLKRRAHALLDRYGVRVSSDPNIREEIERRRSIWSQLVEEGGPEAVPYSVLEELYVDRSEAGIYRDKARTGPLTEDGHGITVSVLHTGARYPDDLGAHHVIYHYPDTKRPESRDQGEIAATKNAGRLGVPLFVLLPGEAASSGRPVRLGHVVEWDDKQKAFRIVFAESPDALDVQVAQHLAQRPGSSLEAEIPHVIRRGQSDYYQVCLSALQEKQEGEPQVPLHVSFDTGADGYSGDVLVEVHGGEEVFRTDWTGSDPTRFPARIRAAATALHDADQTGRFRIWHEEGELVILPFTDRHRHPTSVIAGPQAPDDPFHSRASPPADRPRITIIESEAQIAELQSRFEARLRQEMDDIGTFRVGWQGGSEEFSGFYDPDTDLWAVFHRDMRETAYWNAFGWGDPRDESGGAPIVVEINPPHQGIYRRTAGAFGIDEAEDAYLLHRGNVSGGKGISKTTLLRHRARNLQPVMDGDQTSPVIVVSRLDSEHLLRNIANFLSEVEAFKDAAEGKRAPDSAEGDGLPERDTFTPEFEGQASWTPTREQVDMQCDHGTVVRILRERLSDMGVRAVNDALRDLYVPGEEGGIDVLFEAKTSADRQSIYTAVGQLTLYAPPDESLQRVAVLPSDVRPNMVESLQERGVEVLTYTWEGELPRFDDLQKWADR